MTVYMIWDKQGQKYVSLASKHRKYYSRKQNALNAIHNSYYATKDLFEVHEYELSSKSSVAPSTLTLGSSVQYTKYLTKDKNGVCIYTNLNDNPSDKIITTAYHIDEDGNQVYLAPGEGVSKRLYREVARKGSGIIIDRRNLCINEVLFFDSYNDMYGNDYCRITKDLPIFRDCVKVCYAMGKTRWVPVDCIVKE